MGPTDTDAPLWTLEGLRAADPVLVLALLLLVAVLAAEALHRTTRLPRACGHMLVGALAGPLLLQVVERADLDAWKPLVDLAIGALVFELGTRIRPRWLIDNPGLAASAVAQALLAGGAVTLAALGFGLPMASAAVAGAVAASTSPVIVLSVAHELRSRGQVTERMLMLAAVNSVFAVLALEAVRVVLVASSGEPAGAVAATLRVVSGSFLLGIVAGWALARLAPVVRGSPSMPVVLIAIVILATLIAAQWTLSPLLALLVAGVTARARMVHGLNVEPHLGSAGAALNVVLFLSLGLLFTIDRFAALWPLVAAIVLARLAGTGVAVAALAPASGIGWRQAAALTLALQPMSSLAVLLAADTFGWPAHLPGMHANLLQALLVAMTIMQLTGPVWTQVALRYVAREDPEN